LVPFAIVCFSVEWWDRVHPMVLGLPFNFFWLLAGIIGGVLVTTFFVLTHRDPFFGWNAGFIGLGANLATTGLFARLSGTRNPARVALRPA
jgi:uncharacterized membrane protein